MAGEPAPLTGQSLVGDWLEHPHGGPLIRELLAEAGFDEQVLAPVRGLALRQLAALSQGALSEEAVDELVRRANGGTVPAEAGGEAAARPERTVPGRFEGQTVIVTGAASGIGRATAVRIASEGGRVVAVDLSGDRLGQLPEAAASSTVVADLTEPAHIDRILAAAGTRIDGLANVAGIADDFAPLHETTDAAWERVFAADVDGLFRLTRAVLPAMLEAQRGSIVNVASEAALRGSAAGVAYTAAKHAVLGITRSAAFMYGPHGIRANAVAPGGVATGIQTVDTPSEFGRSRTNPFLALIPPVATAEQLAASITFLLSDDAENISGAVLPSDGGWSVQ